MSRDLIDFASRVAGNLFDKALADEFKGYDPFDGLNSKFFQATRLDRSRLARLAWLQFHKLNPINFRPLLAVPKTRNAKAVALFLLGLCQRFRRTGEVQLREKILSVANLLCAERIQSERWPYACWGYPFPWQAKAFFVPLGTPNAISTTYAALALYDATVVTGEQRFALLAAEAGRFIDQTLYVEAGAKSFFQYVPGESALVHNANLWASYISVESAVRRRDNEMLDRALRAIRHTVASQRPDGSWVYGDQSHHQFVDGFHTGYNLEALWRTANTLQTQEFTATLNAGCAYYRRSFLLADGRVKYYNNQIYPLDLHSIAQAILILCIVPKALADANHVAPIVRYALNALYRRRTGMFVYQKRRLFVNSVAYLRWTQAWMAYALELFCQTQTQMAH